MPTPSFRAINKDSVGAAGPRYTPGVDPAAPNIAIEPLRLILGGLAYDKTLAKELANIADGIVDALKDADRLVRDRFAGRSSTPAHVVELMRALARPGPVGINIRLRELRLTSRIVRRALRPLIDGPLETARTEINETRKNALQSESFRVQKLERAIRLAEEWNEEFAGQSMQSNSLLILGDWGTGKTHFLCDIVRERVGTGLPTLFVLAHRLQHGLDPLQAICDATRAASGPNQLFRRLERLGRNRRQRALLIVDGINEGDRTAWRRSIPELGRLATKYQHVGIVVSCRRPFEKEIFPAGMPSRFTSAEHYGLRDVEFDAQMQFFDYYQIPAPETPLLLAEFARPLFLKTFCETIRDLGKRAQREYLRDLASGQKGITRLLEDFAKRIGGPIERAFGLPTNACWRLIKGFGTSPDGEPMGLAEAMARSLEEWIPRSECLQIIGRATRFKSAGDQAALLQRLTADGLLSETTHWVSATETQTVISLPYQRFSDHVVARHLMDKQLSGKQTDAAIRRAFYANRPLGKVFELWPGGHAFKRPNLAAAIMLEFPERVKRSQLHEDHRELVYFLPKACRAPQPLREVFLGGLAWRSRDSFCRDTIAAINGFLQFPAQYGRNDALEALVGLATRHDHPLNATRLYRYLGSQTLKGLDLLWTEFLRQSDNSSAVTRAIEWIERTSGKHVPAQSTANYLTLLATFLSTTRRTLRDRATRAVVILGERDPSALFMAVDHSLSFVDPYVPERMLAAAYGVAMRTWADPNGDAAREHLPAFARKLVDLMFVPGAPHATKHALRRDSALGIIELAQRVDPQCVPNRLKKYLRPPFAQIPTPFPAVAEIDEAAAEAVKSAMHMDFENYSLGGLIRERQNYNADQPEWIVLRKKVLSRIAELGYDSSAFGTIDDEISRINWNHSSSGEREKIDRYGKKYSWIAYFEMYGVQADLDQLPAWRDPRPADVDLDPSFPGEMPAWEPKLSRVFQGAPSDEAEWILRGPTPNYNHLLRRTSVDGVRGPWILIDAYINEPAETDARRVFTFVRTLLARAATMDHVIRRYQQVDYPGNSMVPDTAKDHYTFGGEVPWSRLFCSADRDRWGRPRPSTRRAFLRHERGRWMSHPVEVIAWTSEWESHHSQLNRVSHGRAPTAAVAALLDLVNHAGTWDLFDSRGRRATIARRFRTPGIYFSSHFLYLRESLLNRYLTLTRQELTWFIWGERALATDALRAFWDSHRGQIAPYSHVHRTFRRYTRS